MSFTEARLLTGAGRFAAALQVLGQARSGTSLEVEVLRAHLLERTGVHDASRSACERLLRNHRLTAEQRSSCEIALGLIAWDSGDTDSSVIHFQKAVAFASTVDNLEGTCWAQLRLMRALTIGSDAHAPLPLLNQLRANSIRLGDPILSAAIHIFIGEIEGRRGLSQNARRHTLLGQQLFGEPPNYWLAAIAENNLVGLAIMDSDFHTGLLHAEASLRFAKESGARNMLRASLANIGNLYWMTGQQRTAAEVFERAQEVLPSAGEASNACFDTMARIHLEQGRLREAEEFLDRIDRSVRLERDNILYANRYAQLTRAQLLSRCHRFREAEATVEKTMALATRAGDPWLLDLARLTKAETLGDVSRVL